MGIFIANELKDVQSWCMGNKDCMNRNGKSEANKSERERKKENYWDGFIKREMKASRIVRAYFTQTDASLSFSPFLIRGAGRVNWSNTLVIMDNNIARTERVMESAYNAYAYIRRRSFERGNIVWLYTNP